MGPSIGMDDLLAVTDAPERDLLRALQPDARYTSALDREGWRAMCEVAARTFTAPLLAATLREAGLLAAAPDEVAAKLARARAWSAARWALASEQLDELGAAFAAAGVRALVLKGAHVGAWYATPGARGMGDLDLWVDEAELEPARAVMAALGYRADEGAWLDEHPEHRHLAPFVRAESLPVELHWTLGRRAEGTDWASGVWSRAVPFRGGLLAMEPVDLLLYTCKHLAAHHAFNTTNGLAGLADLKVIAARAPIDAAALGARADAWGVRRSVALCLMLARDLLGAALPAEVFDAVAVDGLAEVAPSAVWALFHVGGFGATRHLQLPTRALLNPPPPISAVRAGAAARAAWHFARRSALPPVDDLRLERPALRGWLAPAGYPLLWGTLAWRHLGLLRLLDPATRAAARAHKAAHQQRLRDFLGEEP